MSASQSACQSREGAIPAKNISPISGNYASSKKSHSGSKDEQLRSPLTHEMVSPGKKRVLKKCEDVDFQRKLIKQYQQSNALLAQNINTLLMLNQQAVANQASKIGLLNTLNTSSVSLVGSSPSNPNFVSTPISSSHLHVTSSINNLISSSHQEPRQAVNKTNSAISFHNMAAAKMDVHGKGGSSVKPVNGIAGFDNSLSTLSTFLDGNSKKVMLPNNPMKSKTQPFLNPGRSSSQISGSQILTARTQSCQPQNAGDMIMASAHKGRKINEEKDVLNLKLDKSHKNMFQLLEKEPNSPAAQILSQSRGDARLMLSAKLSSSSKQITSLSSNSHPHESHQISPTSLSVTKRAHINDPRLSAERFSKNVSFSSKLSDSGDSVFSTSGNLAESLLDESFSRIRRLSMNSDKSDSSDKSVKLSKSSIKTNATRLSLSEYQQRKRQSLKSTPTTSITPCQPTSTVSSQTVRNSSSVQPANSADTKISDSKLFSGERNKGTVTKGTCNDGSSNVNKVAATTAKGRFVADDDFFIPRKTPFLYRDLPNPIAHTTSEKKQILRSDLKSIADDGVQVPGKKMIVQASSDSPMKGCVRKATEKPRSDGSAKFCEGNASGKVSSNEVMKVSELKANEKAGSNAAKISGNCDARIDDGSNKSIRKKRRTIKVDDDIEHEYQAFLKNIGVTLKPKNKRSRLSRHEDSNLVISSENDSMINSVVSSLSTNSSVSQISKNFSIVDVIVTSVTTSITSASSRAQLTCNVGYGANSVALNRDPVDATSVKPAVSSGVISPLNSGVSVSYQTQVDRNISSASTRRKAVQVPPIYSSERSLNRNKKVHANSSSVRVNIDHDVSQSGTTHPSIQQPRDHNNSLSADKVRANIQPTATTFAQLYTLNTSVTSNVTADICTPPVPILMPTDTTISTSVVLDGGLSFTVTSDRTSIAFMSKNTPSVDSIASSTANTIFSNSSNVESVVSSRSEGSRFSNNDGGKHGDHPIPPEIIGSSIPSEQTDADVKNEISLQNQFLSHQLKDSPADKENASMDLINSHASIEPSLLVTSGVENKGSCNSLVDESSNFTQLVHPDVTKVYYAPKRGNLSEVSSELVPPDDRSCEVMNMNQVKSINDLDKEMAASKEFNSLKVNITSDAIVDSCISTIHDTSVSISHEVRREGSVKSRITSSNSAIGTSQLETTSEAISSSSITEDFKSIVDVSACEKDDNDDSAKRIAEKMISEAKLLIDISTKLSSYSALHKCDGIVNSCSESSHLVGTAPFESVNNSLNDSHTSDGYSKVETSLPSFMASPGVSKLEQLASVAMNESKGTPFTGIYDMSSPGSCNDAWSASQSPSKEASALRSSFSVDESKMVADDSSDSNYNVESVSSKVTRKSPKSTLRKGGERVKVKSRDKLSRNREDGGLLQITRNKKTIKLLEGEVALMEQSQSSSSPKRRNLKTRGTYTCQICSKSFTLARLLDSHLKKDHSNDVIMEDKKVNASDDLSIEILPDPNIDETQGKEIDDDIAKVSSENKRHELASAKKVESPEKGERVKKSRHGNKSKIERDRSRSKRKTGNSKKDRRSVERKREKLANRTSTSEKHEDGISCEIKSIEENDCPLTDGKTLNKQDVNRDLHPGKKLPAEKRRVGKNGTPRKATRGKKSISVAKVEDDVNIFDSLERELSIVSSGAEKQSVASNSGKLVKSRRVISKSDLKEDKPKPMDVEEASGIANSIRSKIQKLLSRSDGCSGAVSGSLTPPGGFLAPPEGIGKRQSKATLKKKAFMEELHSQKSRRKRVKSRLTKTIDCNDVTETNDNISCKDEDLLEDTEVRNLEEEEMDLVSFSNKEKCKAISKGEVTSFFSPPEKDKIENASISDKQSGNIETSSELKLNNTIKKTVYSPPKQRKFKCKICRSEFLSEKEHTKHALTHRQRTYDCYKCGEKLTTMRALTKHLLVHDEVSSLGKSRSIHSCDRCSETFETENHLMVHKRIHELDETTCTCTLCSIKHDNMAELYNHVTKLHPQDMRQVLRCSPCSLCFATIPEFRKHLTLSHRMSAKEASIACKYKGVLPAEMVDNEKENKVAEEEASVVEENKDAKGFLLRSRVVKLKKGNDKSNVPRKKGVVRKAKEVIEKSREVKRNLRRQADFLVGDSKSSSLDVNSDDMAKQTAVSDSKTENDLGVCLPSDTPIGSSFELQGKHENVEVISSSLAMYPEELSKREVLEAEKLSKKKSSGNGEKRVKRLQRTRSNDDEDASEVVNKTPISSENCDAENAMNAAANADKKIKSSRRAKLGEVKVSNGCDEEVVEQKTSLSAGALEDIFNRVQAMESKENKGVPDSVSTKIKCNSRKSKERSEDSKPNVRSAGDDQKEFEEGLSEGVKFNSKSSNKEKQDLHDDNNLNSKLPLQCKSVSKEELKLDLKSTANDQTDLSQGGVKAQELSPSRKSHFVGDKGDNEKGRVEEEQKINKSKFESAERTARMLIRNQRRRSDVVGSKRNRKSSTEKSDTTDKMPAMEKVEPIKVKVHIKVSDSLTETTASLVTSPDQSDNNDGSHETPRKSSRRRSTRKINKVVPKVSAENLPKTRKRGKQVSEDEERNEKEVVDAKTLHENVITPESHHSESDVTPYLLPRDIDFDKEYDYQNQSKEKTFLTEDDLMSSLMTLADCAVDAHMLLGMTDAQCRKIENDVQWKLNEMIRNVCFEVDGAACTLEVDSFKFAPSSCDIKSDTEEIDDGVTKEGGSCITPTPTLDHDYFGNFDLDPFTSSSMMEENIENPEARSNQEVSTTACTASVSHRTFTSESIKYGSSPGCGEMVASNCVGTLSPECDVIHSVVKLNDAEAESKGSKGNEENPESTSLSRELKPGCVVDFLTDKVRSNKCSSEEVRNESGSNNEIQQDLVGERDFENRSEIQSNASSQKECISLRMDSHTETSMTSLSLEKIYENNSSIPAHKLKRKSCEGKITISSSENYDNEKWLEVADAKNKLSIDCSAVFIKTEDDSFDIDVQEANLNSLLSKGEVNNNLGVADNISTNSYLKFYSCDNNVRNDCSELENSENEFGRSSPSKEGNKPELDLPLSASILNKTLPGFILQRGETFDCRYCLKSFRRLSSVKQHTLTHINSIRHPFKCMNCTASFMTCSAYLEHKSNHFSQSTPSISKQDDKRNMDELSTPEIKESNADREDAAAGVQCGCESLKVSSINTKPFQRSRYYCKCCPMNFKDLPSYRLHLRSYHNVWNEVGKKGVKKNCSKCGLRFSSRRTLLRHDMFVHSGSSNNCRCPVCGRVFLKSSYMKSHKLSHKEIFPFRCFKCDHLFDDRVKLYTHIKLHKKL